MKRLICNFALLFCVALRVAIAQDISSNAHQADTDDMGAALAPMKFSRPRIISDLNAKPSVAGRFDCDRYGTIYTFIDGYAPNTGATPKQRLELLGIHPDGSVTDFPWRGVTGFSEVSLPMSVFVSGEDIYVLVKGTKTGAKQGRKEIYPVVLTFNLDGNLQRTTMLEQGLDPLVLGVFPSGKMLVMSEDRLNHRVALDLFGPDGVALRQMDLGDSDYIAHSPQIGSRSRRYNSTLLISMAKMYPLGDHLLLLPLETSGLALIEISEQGVIRAVMPQLPPDAVVDALIAATEPAITVRLATVVETEHPALDAEGNLLGVGTKPSQQLSQLSLTDGSVKRTVPISSPGVQPACESAGVLHLLTANGVAGKLAVVTAEMP